MTDAPTIRLAPGQSLRGVTTIGSVQILARDKVRGGLVAAGGGFDKL